MFQQCMAASYFAGDVFVMRGRECKATGVLMDALAYFNVVSLLSEMQGVTCPGTPRGSQLRMVNFLAAWN